MQRLEDFGELMLGTRLKRISERMYNDIDKLYRQRNIQVSSRCMAPIVTLLANGPMAISELAAATGQSHAAISQVSKILLKQNLIDQRRDREDERRRVLVVNEGGKALAAQLEMFWADVTAVLSQAIRASGHDLLAALGAFEEQLDKQALSERIVAREQIRKQEAVAIIPYEARYREAFKTLNVEWLERYFYVEAFDDKVLSSPEKYILEPGGHIFFARIGEEIVGTSALIKEDDDCYELSKMSVTEKCQGLGLGRRLAQAAIDKFHSLGAAELFLESNKRLAPALKLYESLGFEHRPPRQDSHYQRADVYMVYREKN